MMDERKESTHEDVHAALTELHEALSREGELDQDLRTELEEAALEIAQALERSSDEAQLQQHSDTAQRLSFQLEVSHPVLTDVLNRLTQQLANLGI